MPRGAKSDEAYVREVLGGLAKAGRLGEQIKCVVSVSMPSTSGRSRRR